MKNRKQIETESNDARYRSSFVTFAINNGVLDMQLLVVDRPLPRRYVGSWDTFCGCCLCGEVAIVKRLKQE